MSARVGRIVGQPTKANEARRRRLLLIEMSPNKSIEELGRLLGISRDEVVELCQSLGDERSIV